MHILITGATGFIGRHLVPFLGDAFPLTLLLRQPLPRTLHHTHGRHPHLIADLRHKKTLLHAIQQTQPDVVIHLAAVGATNPFLPAQTAIAHNLLGSINLMQACFAQQTTVQRLIIARTTGEQSQLNTYATSKAAVWQFAQLYSQTNGWPIVGAMIFQCYGAHQPSHALIPAAIRAAQAGNDFPMTNGQQTRDFIHVADVCTGLAAMASAPTLPARFTAELGTGIITSLHEVTQHIYTLIGRGGQPLLGAIPTRPGEQPQPIAQPLPTDRKSVV